MPSMLTVASMMPLASPPPCTEPQGHNGWVAGELAEDGCAVPRSGRSCTTSCCPGWPGWYWRCLLWHCRSGSDSCTTTSHAPRYLEQEHRGRLPSGARRKGGSGQPPGVGRGLDSAGDGEPSLLLAGWTARHHPQQSLTTSWPRASRRRTPRRRALTDYLPGRGGGGSPFFSVSVQLATVARGRRDAVLERVAGWP